MLKHRHCAGNIKANTGRKRDRKLPEQGSVKKGLETGERIYIGVSKEQLQERARKTF